MLRLYYSRIPDEEYTIPAELLSSYRAEKIEKLNNARARRQSAAAELLLRFALTDSGFSMDGPPDIAVGKYGKPFLRSGECFFSLSHSADALICALSDREIGADVQLRSAAQPTLIERFLAEDERSYILAAADPDGAFTEIWTKKESYVKRDGRGLAPPLGSFCVFDGAIAPLLWHASAEEYHLALCSEAVTAERPELIEVKADALFP